jgi:hypothetical protein
MCLVTGGYMIKIETSYLGSAAYVIYGEENEAYILVTGKGFLGLSTELYNILKEDRFKIRGYEEYQVAEDVRLRLQKYDELVSKLTAEGFSVVSTTDKRFNMNYYIVFKSFNKKNVYMVQERGTTSKGEIRGLFDTKEEAEEFILYLHKMNGGRMVPLFALNNDTKLWVAHITALSLHAKVSFSNTGLLSTRKRMGTTRAKVLMRVKELLAAHTAIP